MKYRTFRNLVMAAALVGAGAIGWAMRGSGQAPTTVEVAPEVPSRRSAASTPAAIPDPELAAQPAAPATGQAHERYLLETLGQTAKGDKIKDALGRGSVKVNVYNEGGRWARAKVDLDRDEKWDEKWWLDGSQVSRAVAPDDDERYGAAQTMR